MRLRSKPRPRKWLRPQSRVSLRDPQPPAAGLGCLFQYALQQSLMTKIAIIDYQMGNLRSVQKGFEKVGQRATITSDPQELAAAVGRARRAVILRAGLEW